MLCRRRDGRIGGIAEPRDNSIDIVAVDDKQRRPEHVIALAGPVAHNYA
jgi:hypothetical protein